MGWEFQCGQMERSGDGCWVWLHNNVNLIPLNHARKVVKTVTSKLRIFSHNKKLFNLTMPIVGTTMACYGPSCTEGDFSGWKRRFPEAGAADSCPGNERDGGHINVWMEPGCLLQNISDPSPCDRSCQSPGAHNCLHHLTDLTSVLLLLSLCFLLLLLLLFFLVWKQPVFHQLPGKFRVKIFPERPY